MKLLLSKAGDGGRELFAQIGVLLATSTACVVIVLSLMNQYARSLPSAVGEVAVRTVRSPADFSLTDPQETERHRAEAAAAVERVFVFDSTAASRVEEKLEAFFLALSRRGLQSGERIILSASERQHIERQFDVNLRESDWEVLSRAENWPLLKRTVRELVDPLIAQGIVSDRALLPRPGALPGAILFIDGEERGLSAESPVLDLHQARAQLIRALESRSAKENKAFLGVAQILGLQLLVPNIMLDHIETNRRLSAVRDRIQPSYVHVRRGEAIVRAGDVIGAAEARKLIHLQGMLGGENRLRSAAGFLLLNIIILFSLYFFRIHCWPSRRPSIRNLQLTALTLIGSFLLLRLMALAGDHFVFASGGNSATTFALLTPFAAGGILLQVTAGTPSVFLFTTAFALLSGISLEDWWLLVLLIFVGNIAGALGVRECSRRSEFIVSGLQVALMNALITTCFIVIFPHQSGTEGMIRILLTMGSGLISGILALGLAPVAEFVGGYATNIKLLELASLDQPLLRELSLQAPGTWNHSMVMGQLAEAAAQAVEANPHLARVGAFYHDIGKAKKPVYFVENQSQRDNRHDKLTPSMSALIIKSHVKEGMELAKEHGIPQAVIDFIPQHHGTSLIEFFYDKAAKEAAVGEEVNEMHYRYPGPKPQTKEAGILMLADSIEAASRTLAEPTPGKIQGMVQKIISKIFTSGQLDESELTLKDLNLIAQSFTRTLTGIFHRRIEYAEAAEKKLKIEVLSDEQEPGRAAVAALDSKPPESSSAAGGVRIDHAAALRRLGVH